MSIIKKEMERRRTFAIISHPDAGKTTVTEQLLLYGGAVQLAGTVKARKSVRHATSDWMEMEKARGISITSSVMQFIYEDKIINLLDTPGHADFSEDTYRTLTAVDSALMVIDVAKGVEERTVKLMEICRMRDTPILTFINKLDREGKDPLALLDEIEKELRIECAPVTWPIGMGRGLKGLYHLAKDELSLYSKANGGGHGRIIEGIESPEAMQYLDPEYAAIKHDIAFIAEASHRFDMAKYRAAKQTPVFFGVALHQFGIEAFLEYLIRHSPAPQPRDTLQRVVRPDEDKFSGFVFKIQANMDPAHRDRIAFVRVCSGSFHRGMRLHHVRSGRKFQVTNALTFLAGEREHAEQAWPGDIIGLHNHGAIQVGDTFTLGEKMAFTGIPHFAPELFRRVRLKEPLKSKALLKGLMQLGEEGAIQVFRPLSSNDLILGAIGVLQFEVVIWRLKTEYGVDCNYEHVQVAAVRWVLSDDKNALDNLKAKHGLQLALDAAEQLTYLAPTRVNLELMIERCPEIQFHQTREHTSYIN